MPRPPDTDEGWYVLHDLRTVDWDAWRKAPTSERDRAIAEGREYLEDAVAVEDADAGASATFAILGHEADLMLLHLRPTLDDVDYLERQFAQTALAAFTERTASYVSVTEASGYTGAEDYFDPDAEADPGMRNYIESRLYPDLPDSEFVSFYPMDKRRDPEQNWYDLSFEDRAEYMEAHGDIGREYAGKVSQIISGSIGLDDFEWGVTLFADDPTDVKDLLYEMRFDPSSSRFADFGSFYSGRQFPPSDLRAFLDGERVPTDDPEATAGDADASDSALDAELAAIDVEPPAAGHAVLVHSEADAETVQDEVSGLRGNFEHYDTHRGTEVHPTDDGAAVVSVWETSSAADTASGFLAELTGATETSVGPVGPVEPNGADGEPSGVDAERDATADDRDARQDGGTAASTDAGIRADLEEQGIYGGTPHGEDVYALVCYSEADPAELATAVDELADGFDRYDTHRSTEVYEATGDDGASDGGDGGTGTQPAVVSLWDTEDAAGTASDYLSDLPEIVREAGEGEGFGTMGMFYTVKPEHREDFEEQFGVVGELLDDMDGHRETTLYANREDSNDMFIASQWASKDDAMAFFRSDAFADTVEWGRDVLADRPRHVFLA